MSVYAVSEIIGTSPIGWEEAAKAALAAAAGSLRDLRIAEVVQQDITLGADGKPEAFRVKLRVSFRYQARGSVPERAGEEFGYAQPAQ
jgi:flavin-binding protein dodecin